MRAVVTGAGSGLGRAFCARIAARGGRMVAADVNLAAAEDTARTTGGVAVRCDVGVLADVEALLARARSELGGVDLLVNNAGVGVVGRVGTIPVDDWEWILRVNLWGVIHGCHVFVPYFRAQGRGHVLNVASAAGLVPPPDMAAYSATKAAVVSLSETLAAEGVGVTVLCPTFFPTAIFESSRGADATQLRIGRALMRRARLGAEDVAEAALRGVERKKLYVVPQAEGRWMWRMKRWAPGLFSRLAPTVTDAVLRRIASKA